MTDYVKLLGQKFTVTTAQLLKWSMSRALRVPSAGEDVE